MFAAFEDTMPVCKEILEAAVGEVLMCTREPHNAIYYICEESGKCYRTFT